MGYQRQQFRVMPKRPRHARVPLSVVRCVDCFTGLPVTYPAARFGGRCRSCWLSFVVGDDVLAGVI